MATEKRLIDANACPALFEEKFKETMTLIRNGETHLDNLAEGFTEASQVIWLMSIYNTVDAVEVVHGRWTEAEDGDGAVCSVCGEDFCNIYLEVERFLYCPNCGADMRERKDND